MKSTGSNVGTDVGGGVDLVDDVESVVSSVVGSCYDIASSVSGSADGVVGSGLDVVDCVVGGVLSGVDDLVGSLFNAVDDGSTDGIDGLRANDSGNVSDDVGVGIGIWVAEDQVGIGLGTDGADQSEDGEYNLGSVIGNHYYS